MNGLLFPSRERMHRHMTEALAHRRVELQFDTSGTDIFGIRVPSFDRLESRRGTVERILITYN